MGETTKRVKCSYCEDTFNAQGIGSHIRQKHGIVPKTVERTINGPQKDIADVFPSTQVTKLPTAESINSVPVKREFVKYYIQSELSDALDLLEKNSLLGLLGCESKHIKNTLGSYWKYRQESVENDTFLDFVMIESGREKEFEAHLVDITIRKKLAGII